MDPRHILVDTFIHIPPVHALDGLSAIDAERRLDGPAHTIAEIVAHLTFWQEWFLQRCAGDARPMAQTAGAGWPVVAPASWPDVRQRFVAGLDRAASLGEPLDRVVTPPIEFPPLAGYTIRDVVHHIGQHNAHHLGQIILMRQMMGLWPPPAGSWTW